VTTTRSDILSRDRKLVRTREFALSGRSEKRIAGVVKVEICLEDEPMLKERASTENVSTHGARVLMDRKLQPGLNVTITSPNEGVRLEAVIIYCQRVDGSRFAVGLELRGTAEPWARPY